MKMILLLFALAGMFTACQPDDLDTALAINGAKAIVSVSVVDTDGNPFTGYSLSANSSTTLVPVVAENIITLEAAPGSPLVKTDILISATNVPGFAGDHFDTVVRVPETLAGNTVNLKARIVVFPPC